MERLRRWMRGAATSPCSESLPIFAYPESSTGLLPFSWSGESLHPCAVAQAMQSPLPAGAGLPAIVVCIPLSHFGREAWPSFSESGQYFLKTGIRATRPCRYGPLDWTGCLTIPPEDSRIAARSPTRFSGVRGQQGPEVQVSNRGVRLDPIPGSRRMPRVSVRRREHTGQAGSSELEGLPRDGVASNASPR